MTLRHGKDALRVETLQADEQPAGVPAPIGATPPPQPVGARRSNGQIADSQAASELGRRGGLARAAKATQLRALTGLGLRGATPTTLAPYLEDANQFAESEVERLARECGGGVCPQNAAALVQQAALAMAGSRAAYAIGDTVTGAKLGVEVRQNLLGARELTVREAQARPVDPTAHHRALEEAFGRKP
ncbi:MAG: hypothetical protein WDO74_16935 [Pseudomonadota bacterium]